MRICLTDKQNDKAKHLHYTVKRKNGTLLVEEEWLYDSAFSFPVIYA